MTHYNNLALGILIGLTLGSIIIVYGIRLGFKLSAEIRAYKGDEDVESDLFKPRRDPAEFQLLDEPKKEKDDEDVD
jgi:hypothetical protein